MIQHEHAVQFDFHTVQRELPINNRVDLAHAFQSSFTYSVVIGIRRLLLVAVPPHTLPFPITIGILRAPDPSFSIPGDAPVLADTVLRHRQGVRRDDRRLGPPMRRARRHQDTMLVHRIHPTSPLQARVEHRLVPSVGRLALVVVPTDGPILPVQLIQRHLPLPPFFIPRDAHKSRNSFRPLINIV